MIGPTPLPPFLYESLGAIQVLQLAALKPPWRGDVTREPASRVSVLVALLLHLNRIASARSYARPQTFRKSLTAKRLNQDECEKLGSALAQTEQALCLSRIHWWPESERKPRLTAPLRAPSKLAECVHYESA
jgi:hypothetical protein